jgi:hypothetical protein
VKALLFEFVENRKEALESQMMYERNIWITVEHIKAELTEEPIL